MLEGCRKERNGVVFLSQYGCFRVRFVHSHYLSFLFPVQIVISRVENESGDWIEVWYYCIVINDNLSGSSKTYDVYDMM